MRQCTADSTVGQGSARINAVVLAESEPEEQGVSMLLKKAVDREWKPTDYPGIERSLFRSNESGGRSSVVRLTEGSRFPRHGHHGTEEVVVLSGTVSLGGVTLAEGDYLFTDAGEEHDVVAVSDALIFVTSQKATPVVGP